MVFLDFDGVINSHQSFNFWHNKRDQKKWENELYTEWKGTLYEYLAQEFCPIALNNLEDVFRQIPDIKIVVSSTWRLNNDVEALKKILEPAKLVSAAVIDRTPRFTENDKCRGDEIQDWLNRHPEVTEYVIIDDSSDMLDSQKERFVRTSTLHGFLYGDKLRVLRLFGKTDQWAGTVLV